ncbi:MAG: 1-(5-phosphoribosyl)-5-[(5-phosphoribosylamino) methylideneamino]imidazole-4-carboxamide isomerase [Anaerolineae bacterium]
MIIYPAIDLRNGRCVRLVQGDPQAETVVSPDPVATARRWESLGAEWLHVVNLDGAFGERSQAGKNAEALAAILEATDVPVQFGGGLRTLADLEAALSLGVTRVIIGTAAITHPSLVQEALARFGAERIALAIDARQGYVATHGWQQRTDITAIELALQMKAWGITRVIYTDIARDGTLRGVNAPACAALAAESGLAVIASGGVASLEDVRRVKEVEATGVDGLIIGKALYAGQVELPAALEVARS